MEKIYKCSKCRNEYATSEIRLTPDSKIVCVYCLGKKSRDVAPEKKEETLKEEHIEYVCAECKYEFKRKKSQAVKLCPYCGKGGKVIAKTNVSADNILKQSSNEFDF